MLITEKIIYIILHDNISRNNNFIQHSCIIEKQQCATPWVQELRKKDTKMWIEFIPLKEMLTK